MNGCIKQIFRVLLLNFINPIDIENGENLLQRFG